MSWFVTTYMAAVFLKYPLVSHLQMLKRPLSYVFFGSCKEAASSGNAHNPVPMNFYRTSTEQSRSFYFINRCYS